MNYPKGVSIIEASAGTGKTYTLCRIALRLMLEEGISIDRILAVTFTEAATIEMKSRIRDLLQQCHDEIRLNRIQEPILIELLEKADTSEQELLQKLRLNLELFDEASIYTIHGFCKQALEQTALESSSPMQADIDNVEETLVEQLRSEFIRIRIIEASHTLSALYQKDNQIEDLLKTIGRETSRHPYARIEPNSTEQTWVDLDRALQDIVSEWESFAIYMEAVEPSLAKNRKFGNAWRSGIFETAARQIEADQFANSQSLEALSFATLENFLKAFLKAKAPQCEPEWIRLVDSFWESARNAKFTLANQYRNWLSDGLATAKQRNNTLSFNDLLHKLKASLMGPHGKALVRILRSRYDAALIDEFQDTDPVQYYILDTLFNDSDKYLFFIGDPKQAIYRFRGADIFAYIDVANSAKAHHTSLDTNYRSRPNLVGGLNAFFSSAREGFIFEEIGFDPVKSGNLESSQGLENEGLRFYAFKENEKHRLSINEKSDALSSLTASKIAQLINSKEKPGDIAVLVNTNDQADRIQNRLNRIGIQSVLKAERSVFKTAEASLIRQLLTVLDRPSDTLSFRALLLTPLCGYSWHDLPDEELDDANQSTQSINDFLAIWKSHWETVSFDERFRTFLKHASATKRLLAYSSQERSYSNLLHLSELLDSQKREHGRSPLDLRIWLERQIEEDVSKNESWQVRLGSDTDKVQIVTIHKSKGLEFPIVFCPFLSLLKPSSHSRTASYHSSGDNQLRIHLDPEQNEIAKNQAAKEDLAEQIRLIYVALTRAKKACHVMTAPEESARRSIPSALARFLLGTDRAQELLENKALSEHLCHVFSQLSEQNPSSIFFDRFSLDEIDSPTVADTFKQDFAQHPFKARPVTITRLGSGQKILSFTSISKGIESAILENREFDESDNQTSDTDLSEINESISIHTLPKGARTGDLLHKILEEADLSKETSITSATRESFDSLNFGYPEYRIIVAEQMKALISIPLSGESADFQLRNLKPESKLNELEFAYRMDGNIMNDIATVFEKHHPSHIPKSWIQKISRPPNPATGSYVRGFIDLVCEVDGKLYIFDWKSNHLGYQSADYDQSSIASSMSEHDYYLQYHLYSVALFRQIRSNWPDRDFDDLFGGVFYIFLRGIKHGSSYGIFYDKPSHSLIRDLSEAIDTG